MRQIIPTYSFVAASKTITLTDFTTVRLDRILLIVNATRNVIYYNLADSTLGATVATNVITLTSVSTTGHANGDKLEVFYDTVSGDPDYLTAVPSSVADGSNIVQGATTDASVAAGATGSFSAKLRRLTTDTDAVKTSVAAIDTGTPAALGSTTSSASMPVVIASDQATVAVTAAGNVASAATDSGNPVKAGGIFLTNATTLTTGQRGDMQVTANGALRTMLGAAGASAADGASNTVGFANRNDQGGAVTNISPGVMNTGIFNGTTWDRPRNNIDVAVLASSSRTTTQTGADTTNYNGWAIRVVLDVTTPGSGSITLTIQGKDANSVYYTLLTGAAVTTTSTNVYTLNPGATAVANATVNDFLPRVYRIVVTANNANAMTYSVSSTIPSS